MVVPVKALGEAKSRLRSSDAVGDISALALAFATDTVSAALSCRLVEEVVVVTSDPVVADRMSVLGARIVDDPRAGLNAAASAGIASCDGPVAVLTGDLPALRSPDLDSALSSAAAVPLSLVPDREGSGTTMIAAPDPRMLHPQFGAGSSARHRASGHVELVAGESLRSDVDTEDDLRRALHLGVGTATAAAIG